MPVCTSSSEQQRAVLVASARSPARKPGGAGSTPPSPCSGSTMIAAHVGPIALSHRVEVAVRDVRDAGRASPNPSRYFGVPVIDSAPIVRPWNALWNAMIRVRSRLPLREE